MQIVRDLCRTLLYYFEISPSPLDGWFDINNNQQSKSEKKFILLATIQRRLH